MGVQAAPLYAGRRLRRGGLERGQLVGNSRASGEQQRQDQNQNFHIEGQYKLTPIYHPDQSVKVTAATTLSAPGQSRFMPAVGVCVPGRDESRNLHRL